MKQILKQDDEKLKAALLPSLLCEVVYSKNYDLMYALMKENINFNVSVNAVQQDPQTWLLVDCTYYNHLLDRT